MNFKKKSKMIVAVSLIAALMLVVGGLAVGAYAAQSKSSQPTDLASDEASGGNTADIETPPTEQSEVVDETEPTEPTEQSETVDQPEPTEQMEQSETADQPEPTEQTETTGFVPVPDYLGAKALGRPEHVRLRYYGESSPTAPMPRLASESTLYIGDDYSIYIFDEEWVYQAGTMGGRHADIWKNVLNEKVEMRIVKMDSFSESEDWVREQYPEYEMWACECGGLSYYGDDITIEVDFHSLGDHVYAAIHMYEAGTVDRYDYPMEEMFRTLRPFFYFPTAKELGRPEQMQLTCRAGGEEIASEASLYVGDSYSIYVPDEDWTTQTGTMEWRTVGAWKSTLYEGAELRIEIENDVDIYFYSVRDANPGYILTEGENGEITGVNAEGFRMEVIRTSETYDGRTFGYTIYKVYPTADAKESERAKALLDAMADTFKPFKNKVSYYLMHL